MPPRSTHPTSHQSLYSMTCAAVCRYCRSEEVRYRTFAELIRLNVDYLVDRVSHDMRYLDLNPTTPNVLRVIIRKRCVRAGGGLGGWTEIDEWREPFFLCAMRLCIWIQKGDFADVRASACIGRRYVVQWRRAGWGGGCMCLCPRVVRRMVHFITARHVGRARNLCFSQEPASQLTLRVPSQKV